jgi:UrcA family protein
MIRKLFAVASACAFLSAAFAGTPSFAQDRPVAKNENWSPFYPTGEEEQMSVRTSGLDLQSDSGARITLARIKFAAVIFCGADDGIMGIERTLLVRRCMDRMTSLAVSRLDAPLVTDLFYAMGGKPPSDPENR